MKNKIIIHPFMFALYPILFLFYHNINQVVFSETLFAFLSTLLFTIFLLFILKFVFNIDYKKAALMVTVFLFVFFSYGHVYNIIQKWQLFGITIGKRKYLFLLFFLLFFYIEYLLIKTKKQLYTITLFLNIVSVFLVISLFIRIEVYYLKNNNALENLDINNIEHKDKIIKRDIYYIILDGYASYNTLKNIFNFDNREFLDSLEDRGFYIPLNSRSNYAITPLSLASSLNMEYINYLSKYKDKESIDWSPLVEKIKKNKVSGFLRFQGYKIIHISSDVGATRSNKYADMDIHFNRLNEFMFVLVETTILKAFDEHIIGKGMREAMLNRFEVLSEMYKIKGPKFVFAHIILPHPPYLFDADGNEVYNSDMQLKGNVWKQKDNYISQLRFVNKKVLLFIDQLLSNSNNPPIIILQADHGSASNFNDPDMLDDKPTDIMINERMTIFNAYFLPSFNMDLLYDSISPVNTFRVIFNFYFGSKFPILEDKSYYSTYKYPYNFLDVTSGDGS